MNKNSLIKGAKIFVSLALIWVIWRYFLRIDNFQAVWQHLEKTPVWVFIFAAVVSLANWAVESKKWQNLLIQLEVVSFRTAWKSTCAGAAISNILPFRIGEYLGRVAFIQPENRLPAIFNSVFGSTMQLVISLVFGIPASLFMLDEKNSQLPVYALFGLAAIVAGFALIFYISGKVRQTKNKWLGRMLEDIRKFTTRQISATLGYALLRYLIFSSFYVWLLYRAGISTDILYLYKGVATIYLLQSFAPGMLITDAGLRTGIPLIIFQVPTSVQPALLAAALINYFFNILFPAIIGLYYIIVQKIRTQS